MLATGLPNPDKLLKHGLFVLRLVKHLHRRTAKSLTVFKAIRLLCMQGNVDCLPSTWLLSKVSQGLHVSAN